METKQIIKTLVGSLAATLNTLGKGSTSPNAGIDTVSGPLEAVLTRLLDEIEDLKKEVAALKR